MFTSIFRSWVTIVPVSFQLLHELLYYRTIHCFRSLSPLYGFCMATYSEQHKIQFNVTMCVRACSCSRNEKSAFIELLSFFHSHVYHLGENGISFVVFLFALAALCFECEAKREEQEYFVGYQCVVYVIIKLKCHGSIVNLRRIEMKATNNIVLLLRLTHSYEILVYTASNTIYDTVNENAFTHTLIWALAIRFVNTPQLYEINKSNATIRYR